MRKCRSDQARVRSVCAGCRHCHKEEFRQKLGAIRLNLRVVSPCSKYTPCTTEKMLGPTTLTPTRALDMEGGTNLLEEDSCLEKP